MDSELYRAAQEGHLSALRLHSQHFSTQLTTTKNTPLHVVVLFNDSRECIEEILNANESLLIEVNSDGNSALHIAARNRKFAVASTIITWAKRSDQEVESGGGKLENLLSMRNKKGNTPLHEAIMSDQSEMVAIMLQDYPEIANIANYSSETSLFLAIYEKRTLCRTHIMEYCPFPAYTGPEGRTALYAAAALLNSSGFTQELLKKHPTLIKMADDFGWTALHHAARYGSNDVVNELLEMDKYVACVVAEGDNNMTALHLATREGEVEIMREILTYCPECWDMVTRDDRNILHLAVKFEQEKAVKFILQQSWVGNLINKQDAEGDTPLHIYAATNNLKGVDLVNHLQADQNMDDIEMEFKRKGALLEIWNPINRDNRLQMMKANEERKGEVPVDLRKMGDTQMIVATLMLTVTFAAEFVVPRGYSHNGHAVLSENKYFITFLVVNRLAMVFSIFALCLYIVAAMFSSRRDIIRSYYRAMIFVNLFIFCTMIAFTFALVAIIEEIAALVLTEMVISSFSVIYFGYIMGVTRKRIGSLKNWKNLLQR